MDKKLDNELKDNVEKRLCQNRMYVLNEQYDVLIKKLRDLYCFEKPINSAYKQFEKAWDNLYNEECKYFVSLMEEKE